MGDLSAGIRLRADGSGLVAEVGKGEKSMVGLAAAADKTAVAATAAAEAVSKLGTETGKAAKTVDVLGKSETATASASDKAAASAEKVAETSSRLTRETTSASKAVEVLGKSHAVAAADATKATGTAVELAKSHALVGKAAEISAGQMGMARRIVISNLINVGNVAVATKGDIASMVSPVPDIIYGLRMMGVGFSGMAAMAVASTAAIIGGVLVVGNHVSQTTTRTRELSMALKAMGDVAGISGEQFRRMSEDISGQGGPFGRAETFDAAKSLTAHRRLTGDLMRQIMESGVGMASATGSELIKITEMFAQAFEQGYSGVKKLDEQLGILSADELMQIRTMMEHGHQAEALQVTVEALARRFKGLGNEGMSDAAKAIKAVTVAWNELMDKVAGSEAALTIMRGAAGYLNDFSKAISKEPAQDIGQQISTKSRQLIQAEHQLERLESNSSAGSYGQRMAQEARAEVERLRKEIDELVNRGRSQVAELEAGAAKAQAQASKAAIEASAKELASLAKDLAAERAILQAPAPQRDVARARKQAEDYVRDRQIEGVNPTSGKSFASEVDREMTGAAYDKISAAARDATDAARLQADAQTRLAQAAGQSSEAMRRAAVENQVAQFSYQYLGQGVEKYSQQLWRAYEAEKQARKSEWLRQIDMQVAANDSLSRAYRDGSAAALDYAERENEIREVMGRMGLLYEEAAKGVDKLRESRKVATDKAIADLTREIEASEALTQATRSGVAGNVRKASIDNQVRQFANDNRLSANDNRVTDYRALKEREYSDQVKRSAVETNRAQDATFRYQEAMSKLNEQRASGVLTEKAHAEEWKRIEREKLEASRDFADGAMRAMMDYAEEAGNAAKRAEKFFSSAMKSMEDALVNFVKTGKLDFASLADSIISDLIRMQIQAQITGPLSQALSSGMSGFFEGLFGGGSSSSGAPVGDFSSGGGATMVAHTGGVIGSDVRTSRAVDMGVFSHATRYHSGGISGLKPNERPTILLDGEEVLTQQDPRHRYNLARSQRSGGGDGAMQLNVQIIDQRGGDQPAVQVNQGKGPDGRDLLRIVIPALRKDIASRGEVAQTFEQAYDLRRKAGG